MFSITMLAMGLVFLAFAAAILTMRRYRRRQIALSKPSLPLPAFDMPQLRAMRDSGAISNEEFDRLRNVSLKQMGG